MPNELKIFISHKMPSDTTLANDIGSRLALFSGERVKVSHAGKFRIGEKWRSKVEEELDTADWLIYLHTDPDEDWQFCLFECGYFLGKQRDDDKDRLLITFCRRQDQITPALKEFNALVINENQVSTLFKQIYHQDPWKIYPDLSNKDIKASAKYIVARFLDKEIIRNFDIAPGIMFEVNLDTSAKRSLKSFRMPRETTISGVKDWHKLFGKETETGAWPWVQLASEWDHASVYEFLFAKMMNDAINGDMPRGVLLRSIASHELYRVTLRRYETFANAKKYRFYLTAAELNLPFDLPSDLSEKRETVLYHLVCLTWYFRRRFVDSLYKQLLELSEKKNASAASYRKLYDDIRHELMDIQAQSIIRKVDSPKVVRDALGKDDPIIIQLMDRGDKWYTLQPKIFKLMDKGPSSVHEVIDIMYEIAEINYEFYKMVAQIYSDVSQTLERPEKEGGGEELAARLAKTAPGRRGLAAATA
jgi:hypothetical protein